MMIALDTEVAGLDFHHGARPFFVTIAKDDGTQIHWEWEVNPVTRGVTIPQEDILQIRQHVEQADRIVGQNIKFDVMALKVAGIVTDFPWHKIDDTLTAGHVLESNQKHDLTSMVLTYLRKDIEPYELALEEACNAARRMARSQFKSWRIAKPGDPMLPSLKPSSNVKEEKGWAFDMWLPKTIARRGKFHNSHKWHHILKDYSNADSAYTLLLWVEMERLLKQKKLWKIYREKLKVNRVIHQIECRGLSLSKPRLDSHKEKFQAETKRLGNILVNVASSYGRQLELPKSGINNSVRSFCFDRDGLNLPRVVYTDKGEPSLNKEAFAKYETELDPDTMQGCFVRNLKEKKEFDMALSFIDAYQRFWIPVGGEGDCGGWFRVYPSVNPQGTDTLRMSSSNPNAQQISKQSRANLRYMFGPEEGREWYSLDAQNIELRIPTFESGEESLMDIFLHPDKPPYFGSYHLVIFDLLHPELFKEHGVACKDLFDSTWYQWVKNGNFAVIYGAQEDKADATYRVPGAYRLIRYRFPKIAALSDRMIQRANKYGYVETIPDRSVDASRGYPILCSRMDSGKILPTVPLNYHVQSTACWWMVKALIRVQEQLDQWRQDSRFDGYIAMTIHDELLLDFPKSKIHPKEAKAMPKTTDTIFQRLRSNWWRVESIKRIMERGGDDIGVPTPVGCSYHPDNWQDKEKL